MRNHQPAYDLLHEWRRGVLDMKRRKLIGRSATPDDDQWIDSMIKRTRAVVETDTIVRGLTDRQRRALCRLYDVGAFSDGTSSFADAPLLQPLVLGKLRDMGLVASVGRREGKRRWTNYYLTPKGARIAKEAGSA